MRILFFAFCLTFPAFSSFASTCADGDKIYKECSDQKPLFKNALERAKSEHKMLVLVLGANWCPWCVSMHKVLQNKTYLDGDGGRFDYLDVALYHGDDKLPSGLKVYDQLLDFAGKPEKPKGIPVLVVVNPVTKKAVLMDTAPFEKNTETTKGHDPAKVYAAVAKAESDLK